MLGVTMLTGLRAGCVDLRNSADSFYDKQKLYDIQVVSTLGLEDEDISALSDIDEVDQVVGSYSETHVLEVQDKKQIIQLNAITISGINEPYVLEGRLPKTAKEIAVSEKFLRNSGKKIGDTITFSVDDDSKLKYQTFTICGVILDAMNISVDEGAASFRSTSNVDDTFYVQLDAFDYDVYTSVYVTLKNSKDLKCYSDEYKQMIHDVMIKIEKDIKIDRENARYQKVVDDAWKQYYTNKKQMDNEFSKGDEKLASAREELENGRIQLQNRWQELQVNEGLLQQQSQTLSDEMSNAHTKIQDGFTQLDVGKQRLDEAMKQVQDGEVSLTKAKEDLQKQQDETLEILNQKQKDIETQINDLNVMLQVLSTQETSLSSSISNWPKDEWEAYIHAVDLAYQKIVQLQFQVQTLSQQQSDDAKQQIEILTTSIQKLQESLSQQYELPQQQFIDVLLAQINSTIKQLQGQLQSLDLTSSDYEAQKQKLESKIKELEELLQKVLVLGIQIGQTQASQKVLLDVSTQLIIQKLQAMAGFEEGFSKIQEKAAQLEEGKQKTLDGYRKLSSTQQMLEDSLSTLKQQAQAIQKLKEAKQQIESGKQQLLESEKQLQDGEKELSKQQNNFNKQKEKAHEKLAEGKADIEKIDKATWYVQDRNAMDSYASVESDASSIETVGTAFPIIFLIVAILISLTTITRMVEEERGLIGTYKALGFCDMAIYSKYLIYAFSACFIGGILGDICGFWLLPKFLFTIFQVLYKIPEYYISFDLIYGIGGVLLFVAGIIMATIIACRLELSQMPAVLMRPKAPCAGSRVLLEYIPMIWKHLSFLNKVTMRNLFRFKKRMFMTIGGIMGCTALILCGFAIKDSVNELMPKQYEKIYQYDFMGVVAPEEYKTIKQELTEDNNIKDLIGIRMDNVKVKTKQEGQEESVSMMVIPDGESIEGYIGLENTSGEKVTLHDGIYITENASTVLGFDKHEHIFIQNMDLIERQVEVQEIVQNYLGNMVYMNQKTYESLFGKYESNGLLAHFKDGYEKQTQFVKAFSKKDHVSSAVSVKALRDQFSDAFALINAVVYLITFMAAGLAFVVLFTLSTTNISERERELATIKVLGFFDKEVHLYVNKETVILTGIGILCGLPLGRILSGMLTNALKMPSIHFAVSVYPASYLYAALLSLGFALIVNFMTNRTLNRIDMVEALKSIE